MGETQNIIVEALVEKRVRLQHHFENVTELLQESEKATIEYNKQLNKLYEDIESLSEAISDNK